MTMLQAPLRDGQHCCHGRGHWPELPLVTQPSMVELIQLVRYRIPPIEQGPCGGGGSKAISFRHQKGKTSFSQSCEEQLIHSLNQGLAQFPVAAHQQKTRQWQCQCCKSASKKGIHFASRNDPSFIFSSSWRRRCPTHCWHRVQNQTVFSLHCSQTVQKPSGLPPAPR